MKKRTIRTTFAILAVLLLAAGAWGYRYYKQLYKGNVRLTKNEASYLYVPTGSSFNDLLDSLQSLKILGDRQAFVNAAQLKKFTSPKPGRYKLQNGMTNSRLIAMLRAGEQSPVRLTLSGNIRSKEKVAALASKYIEADSAAIVACLNDKAFLQELGLTSETALGIFLPDTYELYWNTSAEGLVKRMNKEFEKFWSKERDEKREKLGMSRMKVVTLASIVMEETIKADEMPKVAGAYLNRLKAGMPLQADPTVKFAVGDFAIKRVLTVHTQIDSPYNTYMYAGLPPGPICVPSKAAIDAVLNAEKHDYYYFCAKDDFSGYHAFAKTLEQHNQNAAAYHHALNRNKIYK